MIDPDNLISAYRVARPVRWSAIGQTIEHTEHLEYIRHVRRFMGYGESFRVEPLRRAVAQG